VPLFENEGHLEIFYHLLCENVMFFALKKTNEIAKEKN
jgi:hypothetical protein